jgi:hypothetical protein
MSVRIAQGIESASLIGWPVWRCRTEEIEDALAI